jgi:mRNA degradation ribonuclease J1/J2
VAFDLPPNYQEEIALNKGKLTFFGGVDTSGGVQIMYGIGKQALFFDFGTAHHSLLDPGQANTYDPVRTTPGREVRQHILAKMAPPLLELYEPEHVKGLDQAAVRGLWNEYDFPQYDKISMFIGHMHNDHMSLLPYANKDIPVYMNRDTYSLYRGIVESGQCPDTQAKIIPCEDLSVIDFGDFSMQIVEMDHNTVGTSAIILESKDHTIAITGDWRRHGRHPERIDRFIDICRKKGIDLLLTETTRVNPETVAQSSTPRQEAKSMSMYASLLDQAEGLVYLQMSPRDLERMADMIQIAADKGRTIVMDASQAVIWHTANREGVKVLDHHAARNISILILDVTAPAGSELPYPTTSLEEIAARKSEFLYFFKFPNLAHMIELEVLGALRGCSHLIQADYSVGIDHPDVKKYCNAYGIKAHSVSNRGHANPEEVTDLIERIAPKAVIPVHGFHPKLLDTKSVGAYYPYRGETVSIPSIIAAAKPSMAINNN